MTTRFTLTINTSSSDGATQSSERRQIIDVLGRVAQAVGDNTTTSNASLTDRNGVVVGSWSYTGTAAH